jgi:hypothetical protein
MHLPPAVFPTAKAQSSVDIFVAGLSLNERMPDQVIGGAKEAFLANKRNGYSRTAHDQSARRD